MFFFYFNLRLKFVLFSPFLNRLNLFFIFNQNFVSFFFHSDSKDFLFNLIIYILITIYFFSVCAWVSVIFLFIFCLLLLHYQFFSSLKIFLSSLAVQLPWIFRKVHALSARCRSRYDWFSPHTMAKAVSFAKLHKIVASRNIFENERTGEKNPNDS